jgi:hypothetical protein
MLPGRSLAAEQNHRPHETTRVIQRGRPLRDLQQQFVDLRFGMFLHFNMATFQDREWGDPTSSPELFHHNLVGRCRNDLLPAAASIFRVWTLIRPN